MLGKRRPLVSGRGLKLAKDGTLEGILKSPARERAWIETPYIYARTRVRGSPARERAWIETCGGVSIHATLRRPLVSGRGLKRPGTRIYLCG